MPFSKGIMHSLKTMLDKDKVDIVEEKLDESYRYSDLSFRWELGRVRQFDPIVNLVKVDKSLKVSFHVYQASGEEETAEEREVRLPLDEVVKEYIKTEVRKKVEYGEGIMTVDDFVVFLVENITELKIMQKKRFNLRFITDMVETRESLEVGEYVGIDDTEIVKENSDGWGYYYHQRELDLLSFLLNEYDIYFSESMMLHEVYEVYNRKLYEEEEDVVISLSVKEQNDLDSLRLNEVELMRYPKLKEDLEDKVTYLLTSNDVLTDEEREKEGLGVIDVI